MTEPCRNQRMIDEHHKVLFGNGKSGDHEKVAFMWDDYNERKETYRAIRIRLTVMMITSMGTALAVLLAIANVWPKGGGSQ